MKSYYEQIGGTYTEIDGINYPNVVHITTNYPIGLFGRQHENYLKQHEKSHYLTLLTKGTLNSHLHEIDTRANDLYETLITHLAQQQNITEELKAKDMIAWTCAMNNISNQAKDTVYREIVYK